MMHDIRMMAMSFHFYHEVDLEEARELLVYVVTEYLSAINSNEKVRPYLHNYPFATKNIEIRIWIYEPDGTYPPSDKIDYISSMNGLLEYYTCSDPRQPIYEETYEEALQVIASQKLKVENGLVPAGNLNEQCDEEMANMVEDSGKAQQQIANATKEATNIFRRVLQSEFSETIPASIHTIEEY